jgi:pimeloyl-ACP methyl ester carboxylesterase
MATLVTALVALTGCTGTAQPAAPATPSTTAGSPCRDASLRDSAVTFTNSVGATLRGYVLGSGSIGVVLANELQMDACGWRVYAKQLAGRGYRVLAFDFNSDDIAGFVQGSTNHGDVAAAADFLRQRGVATVVLLGASRGGTAVLVAATKIDPPVAGVISLSGPVSVAGTNALAAVPKLTVPVLYVVSDLDRPFSSDAQMLFNATPPTLGKLVVLEGLGHGQQYPLQAASTSNRAMMAVDEFLATHASIT